MNLPESAKTDSGAYGDVSNTDFLGSDHDLLVLQSCVLQNMSEGVSVVDDRGYVLYTNAAEDFLYRCEAGELLGQHLNVRMAYSPEESERRLTALMDCLREKGAWKGELHHHRKDGSTFFTSVRISGVEVRGRKLWVCVQSEITDDKRREMADVKLAAIVESSDDAIITKDLNGIITSWNRGAERIFGYTAEEAIGRPVAMLAVEERLPEMPSILRRLQQGERIEHYETERRTKEGRTISVSLTVSPVRSANGEIIGASKIARDITESRRMQKELAEREQHLATLLGNLPDIIARIGRDYRIIFVSNAVTKATGLPPEHFIGKTHSEAGLPDSLSQLLEAKLAEIFVTGVQGIVEFQLPDPSGVLREYFGLGVPELDAAGNVAAVLTITRDITEQKQAERSQRAVERELMLLVEASSAVIASPESEKVLQTILNLAGRFVDADAYAVWRDEGQYWQLSSSSGLSNTYLNEASRATSRSQTVLEPMMFEDVATSSFLTDRAASYANEGIRSMLVVPLWIHGAVKGSVVYYWRATKKLSTPELRIAAALANLAAAALGTADLYEEERRSRERAQMSERRSTFLARAGAALSSSLDYSATLRNVAELSAPDFADWCSVDVLHERGSVQRVVAHHRDPAMVQVAEQYASKFPQGEEHPARVAMRTGQSLLVEKVTRQMLSQAAVSPEQEAMLNRIGPRSVIVAPMVLGEETLGAITFVSAESGRQFTQQDLEIAEELARRAGTAIAHARLYAHVRESEERLRMAVEAAEVGVWELDIESGALACSDQCKRNVGIAAGEPLDYPILHERIHPADRVAWQSTVDAALANHSTFEVEYRVRSSEGIEKWVLAYGRGVYTPEGRPVRTVGVTIDITERRKLLAREQEARRTAELLNAVGPTLLSELETRRLAQRVIDLATELMGAQSGAFFYAADSADWYPFRFSFSGFGEAAFASLADKKQFEFAEKWISSGVGSAACNVPPGGDTPFTLLNGAQSGSFLRVPVNTRSGQLLGALLFAHCEPDRFGPQHSSIGAGLAAQAAIALENARLFDRARITEEALRQSNEELRRANEDLNQFAYSASHDLQEPLRMVAIYSQMLSRQYQAVLDDKGREYLNFAVQGAKRMEMLVKDLLAYTQAAELREGDVEVVNSGVALRHALLNLQSSIDESRADISCGAMLNVRVNEVHLMQLFQNLTGNAIKYARPGVPPIIRVESELKTDWAEFRVTDNGIGIPERYRKQVFGLFKRLHSGDRYSGTGIGLSICQRIVERYGGRIWVDSVEEAGSTFSFTLPAAQDSAESGEAAQRSATPNPA